MKKTLLTIIVSLLCISTFATPTIVRFDLSDLSANREFVRLSNNPQSFNATFTVMRSLVSGTSQWENIACAVTIILMDKAYKEKKELSVPYTFITDGTESNYKDKTISGKINQSDIQPGDRIGIKLTYDNGTKPVSSIYGTGYKIQESSIDTPGPNVDGPNGTIGIYSWRWKSGGSNSLQPFKDATLANWNLNRLEFYAYSTNQPGTSPIYIFKGNDEGDRVNYVYELDREQDPFWQYQTIKFYAFKTQVPGTVPIFRYSNQAKDYYYSAQDNNIGLTSGNYTKVIAFYAYPPFKELLDYPPAKDVAREYRKPATGIPTPSPKPDRGGGGRGGRN